MKALPLFLVVVFAAALADADDASFASSTSSEDLAVRALGAGLNDAVIVFRSRTSLKLDKLRLRGSIEPGGHSSHYGTFPRAVAKFFLPADDDADDASFASSTQTQTGQRNPPNLREFSVAFTQGRLEHSGGEDGGKKGQIYSELERLQGAETGGKSAGESAQSGGSGGAARRWRLSPSRTPAVAPTGAEVWATFEKKKRDVSNDGAESNATSFSSSLFSSYSSSSSSSSEHEGWKRFVGAAGGIFCGSLQQLTSVSKFARPQLMPLGLYGQGVRSGEVESLYATLPREAACTENLSPWVKLLPSGGKTGLAALLNPERVFDGRYVSMKTHAWVDEASYSLVVEQALTFVLPTARGSLTLGAALNQQHVLRASPYAQQSTVRIFGTESKEQMLPGTDTVVSGGDEEPAGEWTVFDLAARSALAEDAPPLTANQLKFPAATANSEGSAKSPPAASCVVPVVLNRYQTGTGQHYGGVAVHITNPGRTVARVKYLDVLPFFMRVFYSSLEMTLEVPGQSEPRVLPLRGDEALPVVRLLPAEDHSTPGEVELEIILPAGARFSMTFEFERVFLHFTEFPPDAHRGYDVGAGMALAQPLDDTQGKHPETHTLISYSLGLLIDMPTPDFSMPYNVITITGTMFALFFGSMLNLMIRRHKDLKLDRGDFVSSRPIARLVRLLTTVMTDFDEHEEGENAGGEQKTESPVARTLFAGKEEKTE